MYSSRPHTAFQPSLIKRKSVLSAGVAASVLALALAHGPAFAGTTEECGAAVNGLVVCDATGNPYAGGIHYDVAAPAPVQDLTVHLVDADVSTQDNVSTAIGISNSTGGAVTITGTGSITTTGAQANGILTTAIGGVTIDVGDVTTTGDESDGIYAGSNDTYLSGDVSVKAGTVTTSGFGAVAIGAQTQQSNIDIKANAAYTFGEYADAVIASANYGDVSIDVGTSLTIGTSSRGLVAYAQGTATIMADTVATYGNGNRYATSGAIKAAGTQVNVDVGTLRTSGDYATGIYASTNHVIFETTVVPSISVNVGSVSTAGFASDAIVAINESDVGVTSVKAGTVTTKGDYAFGVYASGYGDVTIDTGTVTTAGLGAKAVDVVGKGGNITVSASSIQTAGIAGSGVSTVNYSETGTTDISVGQLSTTRDGAHGIHAEGYGDIKINTDKLSTNGYQAFGISALSVYGDVDVSAGNITAHGDQASAINVAAYYGHTTINSGTIATEGDFSSGIYAIGGGGITIRANSVTTSGDNTVGIGAINFSSDDVSVVAGTITTSGNGAAGLVEVSYGGTLTVDVDKIVTTGAVKGPATGTGAQIAQHEGQLNAHFNEISTQGNYSSALSTSNSIGDQHVVVSKSLSTAGKWAPGLLINQETGDGLFDLNATITTTGQNANGIQGVQLNGDLTINAAGAITTSGDGAAGITLTVLSFGFPPNTQYGETEPFIMDATAHVAANSITTSGAHANGIDIVAAHNAYYADSPIITDAIIVSTGSVKVTGEGSAGIHLSSQGAVTLDAGNTSSSSSNAIDLTGVKTATLNIRGTTVSDTTDAAVVSGGAVKVSLAATGSLTGATNGIVLSGGTLRDPYAEVPVYSPGTIDFNNAGKIFTGTDYGINVTRGTITLANSGAIVGAVKFAEGDDKFTNSGAFNAGKDSDFGAGNDVFVNTGTVNILSGTTTAGSVTLLGLERFENTGGLVDMRNGHAGDSFTLPGAYAASGDARLGLDVTGTTSDKLVVTGLASGKTSLLLAGLTPTTATLIKGVGPTLVQVGAGSTATFDISNADVGLVHYSLKFNAATNSYALQNEAGSAVYGSLKLTDGVQSIWSDSAGAWSSHLATMRGDVWGSGEHSASKGNVWVQTFGASRDRSGEASAANYEQTNGVTQIGADLGHSQSMVWGVTGGYSQSRMDFGASTQKADLSTLNIGGYVSTTFNGYFVNALAKYDHAQVKASDGAAVYAESLDANSYGIQAEIGRRFGDDRFAFEPLASLSYIKSNLDDLKVHGQTLAFDDADALIGKIGGRMSGKYSLKSGSPIIFTAGLAVVQNFSSDQSLTFTSGGVSQVISGKSDGSYGQASLGVTYRTRTGVVTYLEGNSDFGGGKSGTGVRVGTRIQF